MAGRVAPSVVKLDAARGAAMRHDATCQAGLVGPATDRGHDWLGSEMALHAAGASGERQAPRR